MPGLGYFGHSFCFHSFISGHSRWRLQHISYFKYLYWVQIMRSWFSFTLRNIVEKIMSDELLTLSSNDFGKKCHEAFLGWWQNKDFADVTLATSDDCQISVHRVVLASSSQLFRSLLLKKPTPSPHCLPSRSVHEAAEAFARIYLPGGM